MTKSELRQMIREVLKEELSRKKLKESTETTGTTVTLGGAVLDFSNIANVRQLEDALADYEAKMSKLITYSEFVTDFVPKLMNNPGVPDWAKNVFSNATSISNASFMDDSDDNVMAACYSAIEAAGYDSDDFDTDDIADFVSTIKIDHFYEFNNELYVVLADVAESFVDSF